MRRLLDHGSVLFLRKIFSPHTFGIIFSLQLVAGLTLFCFTASAGNGVLKKISGRILNADGGALSGATVTLKGTTNAVTTDNDGLYSLDIPDNVTNPVLVVSSVGYVSQEIVLSGRTNVDINLQVDVRKLDGVVVVG